MNISAIDQQLKQILEILYAESDANTLKNFSHDLQGMIHRLQSGEYQNTEFLDRNIFDTQGRTNEFFCYLDGYYQSALKWKNIIARLPYQDLSIIIDICPGNSPKVQWALQQLGYKNSLIIIDQDPNINNKLCTIMSLFNRTYNYEIINTNIFDQIAAKANLVTANHVLDDIILLDYCQQNALDLRQIYASENKFVEITTRILANYDFLPILEKFVQVLKNLILPNGFCIICNYSGLTERALKLKEWTVFIAAAFNQTRQIFQENQFKILDDSATHEFLILQAGNNLNS